MLKLILKEYDGGDWTNWIDVAQYRDRYWALVNVARLALQEQLCFVYDYTHTHTHTHAIHA
jgi:hypothetical protein